MAYIRESRIDQMTKEDLLSLVKKNLDEVGIPYEEKPGGLGEEFLLHPEDIGFADEEQIPLCYEGILTVDAQGSKRYYQPQSQLRYDHTWNGRPFWGECEIILSVA